MRWHCGRQRIWKVSTVVSAHGHLCASCLLVLSMFISAQTVVRKILNESDDAVVGYISVLNIPGAACMPSGRADCDIRHLLEVCSSDVPRLLRMFVLLLGDMKGVTRT